MKIVVTGQHRKCLCGNLPLDFDTRTLFRFVSFNEVDPKNWTGT